MSQGKRNALSCLATAAWLLVASIIVVPASACAAGPQDLTGDWRGSTDRQPSGQNGVSVDMQITTVKINDKGGRFHFGPPRSCEMALIYKGAGPNDSRQFNFVESHGGFCDRLGNALLTLKFRGPDLTFDIAPIRNSEGEHGVLKKEK